MKRITFTMLRPEAVFQKLQPEIIINLKRAGVYFTTMRPLVTFSRVN